MIKYHQLYRFNLLLIVALSADRCVLVLNKTDLLPEDGRQKFNRELKQTSGLPPICPISCHTNEGLQEFLTVLHSSVETL